MHCRAGGGCSTMSETGEYKNIFKTTFLFGFVQVFNILVKACLNKIVALILGPTGMGVIGLFNTTINFLQTGAGLGISQAAVRDVSEANKIHDNKKYSFIISLINKVVLFTSLLGIIITIILSPFLSNWTFGNSDYIISFICLSIVVGLNIYSEGQLAVLKGMRQLRSLAKASMIGAFVGLVSAVPFYYFFGENGIVPSLFVVACSSVFFSNYYVRKIKFDRIKLTIKEMFSKASTMVKMGCALMFVSFIGYFSDLIIVSYISNHGGLTDVGLYQAGITIITSYFGIIITAMSTDYYPRISAVHQDNIKLQNEMNNQSETGLIMLFPLVMTFVILSSFFIRILYSDEFFRTNEYTDYAMIGSLIISVSNCMGMVLLAKQVAKIFLWSVITQRIIMLGIYILFYNTFGLLGLGLSYIIHGILQLMFMTYILRWNYNITLNRNVVKLLIITLLATLLAIIIRTTFNLLIASVLNASLLIAAIIFSYIYMKTKMSIDVLYIIKRRIRK